MSLQAAKSHGSRTIFFTLAANFEKSFTLAANFEKSPRVAKLFLVSQEVYAQCSLFRGFSVEDILLEQFQYLTLFSCHL